MRIHLGIKMMSKKIYILSIFIAASAGITYFETTWDKSEKILNKSLTSLEKQGDFCAGIAENAIANLHAIVEFQKLEILARKANVMKQCMKDRGFNENPSWLTYASSLAKENAVKLNISEDEALQNLRKNDMFVFRTQNNKPLYWKKFN